MTTEPQMFDLSHWTVRAFRYGLAAWVAGFVLAGVVAVCSRFGVPGAGWLMAVSFGVGFAGLASSLVAALVNPDLVGNEADERFEEAVR
jgi:hypothetical protein